MNLYTGLTVKIQKAFAEVYWDELLEGTIEKIDVREIYFHVLGDVLVAVCNERSIVMVIKVALLLMQKHFA